MKNKKICVSLIGLLFVLMFLNNIYSGNLDLNKSPEISQETTPDGLIPIDFSINIDGNWSAYTEKYSWASGSGTEENPYIIEGIYVTNKEQTAHISIETAEHFIIRNVTVFNYSAPYGHYTFAGIYIEKAEYGLIDNVTIINCSIGISFYEAKDDVKIINSNFIGSHDNNETGFGAAIRIQEAKNVEISNNNIFNYYDGIVIRDAEEVNIESNRIETSFGHISDTGIYFYGVYDSAIIDNDFYGCTFDGHEYDDPFESSFNNLKTSFTNSFNITVYGNRFYDIQGNLIFGEEKPDIPDNSDNSKISTPNYNWIFILVGSLIGISIFLYFYKKHKINGD